MKEVRMERLDKHGAADAVLPSITLILSNNDSTEDLSYRVEAYKSLNSTYRIL